MRVLKHEYYDRYVDIYRIVFNSVKKKKIVFNSKTRILGDKAVGSDGMAKGGEERVNIRGDLEPPINAAPSTQSQPMQTLSAFRVVQFFTELLVFSIPDPLD